MCNDVVCLQKTNGEKYENIKAFVENKMIYLPNTKIRIDEGDIFIRDIDNGKQEVYKVINPVYFGPLGSMGPHYEIEVRKVLNNSEEPKLQNSRNFVRVTGNNSPVTINSNDNLINITKSEINDKNVFEELRKCISNEVHIENKEKLLSSVDELENTKGTSGYLPAYQSFIQGAKDWIVLISPFLPYISNYLK